MVEDLYLRRDLNGHAEFGARDLGYQIVRDRE
jgi:hypothetical protein